VAHANAQRAVEPTLKLKKAIAKAMEILLKQISNGRFWVQIEVGTKVLNESKEQNQSSNFVAKWNIFIEKNKKHFGVILCISKI